MRNKLIELAIESLIDEEFSAHIYRRLSEMYGDKEVSRRLAEAAEMEEKHAEFWRRFLERRGIKPDKYRPSRLKMRLAPAFFRLLGPALTLRLLEMGERRAVETYSNILSGSGLSEDEREGLRRILEDELVHEHGFVEEESKFKDILTHVRDMVLGMNDGLVEVLSVAAGLAGAYGDPLHVALGGGIVGVAGALSMGIGAYTSVRAQRQVRESVIKRVRTAAAMVPRIFVEKVKGYMEAKEISRELAASIAEEARKKPSLLARVIIEEEHGLKEEALEDPGKAGLYTGLFYLLGAFIPLLPYILGLPIGLALPLSLIIAAGMLAATGFLIALSADLDVKTKIIELVASGMGAAAITFAVGRAASTLLGVEVS